MRTDRLLILGVTGSGKGQAAFALARRVGGQILSIDSMKVYRRMDIGTAKPPPALRQEVVYHMIDLVEPSQSFSVGQFVSTARPILDDLACRSIPAIAVGGTALYIKALLYGLFEGPPADPATRQYLAEQVQAQGIEALHRELARVDPEAAGRIHPTDKKRIIRALEVYRLTGRPISQFQTQFTSATDLDDWTVVGLARDRADQAHRINRRVRSMIEQGLVQEVEALLSEPKGLSRQARAAIGYAEITDYLAGLTDLERAVELIKRRTRRLAKAQRTWFRSFRFVHWLDVAPDEPPGHTAEGILALWEGRSRYGTAARA